MSEIPQKPVSKTRSSAAGAQIVGDKETPSTSTVAIEQNTEETDGRRMSRRKKAKVCLNDFDTKILP